MSDARRQAQLKSGEISRGHSRANSRELLLQIMIEALNEAGEANVRLDTILERAQISPSSLYHHFGNLRGLIEAAHVERYISEVYDRIDDLKTQLELMTTPQDFEKIIDGTLDHLFADERRISRFRRLNAIGSSFGRPEFAGQLARCELVAYQQIADVLKVAQDRGFIPASVDLLAFAAWVNTTFSGSVPIDLLDEPDLHRRWAEMVRSSTKYLLGIK
jgi:AcrR family transcriptional regulator